MCGIVGIYLKSNKFEKDLGKMLSGMLINMESRGPDSAGFAIYKKEKKEEFKGRTGLKTVPQIYGPDNEHIGGYDDLKKYLNDRIERINSALK